MRKVAEGAGWITMLFVALAAVGAIDFRYIVGERGTLTTCRQELAP